MRDGCGADVDMILVSDTNESFVVVVVVVVVVVIDEASAGASDSEANGR